MKKYIKSSYEDSVVDNQMIADIENMLMADSIWADAVYDPRGKLSYSIEGDWKHDHLRADYLVEQYFDRLGYDVIKFEEVTDENGSDYYTATHIYKIFKRG